MLDVIAARQASLPRPTLRRAASRGEPRRANDGPASVLPAASRLVTIWRVNSP